MRKLFLLLISIHLCLFAFSQLLELNTNGYHLRFKRIDSLFYKEYPLSDTQRINSTNHRIGITKHKYSLGIVSKSRIESNEGGTSFKTNFYVYEDGTLQAPTSQIFFKPFDAEKFIKTYNYLGKIEVHPTLLGFYYLYLHNQYYDSGESIFDLCKTLIEEKAVSIVEPVFIRHLKVQNPLRPLQWNINNSSFGANYQFFSGIISSI